MAEVAFVATVTLHFVMTAKSVNSLSMRSLEILIPIAAHHFNNVLPTTTDGPKAASEPE